MEPLNLTRVVLSWDVLWACLSHALTTEHQEIMGLLLGCLNETSEGTEAIVRRSMVLSRKDKKKDRVEVGYENLAYASTVAERLAEADNSECRILGWYHSHPHITVLPSHVDVKTQGSYQQLDRGFLGLIFSVFDKGRLEVCAFQSRGIVHGLEVACEWERVEIPVVILHTPKYPIGSSTRSIESLIALQLVLLNEDRQTFKKELTGSSYLEIARTTGVYQNAVFRLVDLQLLPLLMSMKSRIASLKQERQYLHEKSGIINTETHTFVNSSSSGDNAEDNISWPALEAFESAVPEWTVAVGAVKLAREGVLVRVEFSDSDPPHPTAVSGVYIVSVQPTVCLASAGTAAAAVLSPWTMHIGTSFECALVSVGAASAPNEVRCVISQEENGANLPNGSTSTTMPLILVFDPASASDMRIANAFREDLHRALHLHLWPGHS
eukprot:gene10560-22037_t